MEQKQPLGISVSRKIIKWAAPPGRTNRGTNVSAFEDRWTTVAAELRKHPYTWALIMENAGAAAGKLVTTIKRGREPFEPKDAFEATTHKQPDGTYNVYARYVPSKETETKEGGEE